PPARDPFGATHPQRRHRLLRTPARAADLSVVEAAPAAAEGASAAERGRRRSTHYVGASARRARWPQARPRGRLPQPFPHFDVRYPRLFEDGTMIVVPHLLVEAVGVDLGVEDDPVEVAGAGLVLQRLEDAPADPVLAVGNQHGHAPDLAPATGLPF